MEEFDDSFSLENIFAEPEDIIVQDNPFSSQSSSSTPNLHNPYPNTSSSQSPVCTQDSSLPNGAQLGMESMGTEKIIHSINHAQQTHKEWDTICLDYKNAFNLVKRSVIAAKLIADFPQVVNYFRTYYCDSASLLLSDPNTLDVFEFFSCTGIQQGDVNGPFLHNVGTINYVRKLIEIMSEGTCLALQDDINGVAPFHRCIAALEYAIEHGEESGVYLQHSKINVLLGQCDTLQEALERKAKYQITLKISDADADRCIKIHPSNAPPDSDINQIKRRYGVRILGSPIGSPEFITDWLDVKLIELQKEGSTLLKSVTTTQVQWSLLFY